jgi:DNA-binding SARP family transcriptional activator
LDIATMPRPVAVTGSRGDDGERPVLTAHFLGTFHVSIDGLPVDTTSSRRSRHMLAYLLAHRRVPVPRDVLMDVFWPTAEPAAARNSLHVTLSALRRLLRAAYPHSIIERRFDTYRITDSVAVWADVEQFERNRDDGARAERQGDRMSALRYYEAACHLYEADFLADEPYAEWAAPTREALRLDAVEIQSRMVDVYLDRADYGPAAIVARQVLTVDPCNEQTHRSLMTCYAASGQRHLAIAQYHRLTHILWETVRIRPSAETTALFERLRRPHETQVAR